MSITAEKIEQIARALCVADGLDPDEEIHGNQAAGFENYGPRWQAQEKAEGQIYGPNYVRLAQGVLPLLQQGEPEGALRKAYNKIEQHMFDYTHETHSYDASTNAWECSNGEVVAYVEGLDKALEIIKPLLSASPLPPAPVQGWRPIETAPKDGTKIITFAPDGGIEVSFYYADTLENGTAYETWRDDGCEPTHWMPLPPAPGAETGEHEWFRPNFINYDCCRKCGIVRRADGKNKPCKGQVYLRPLETPFTNVAYSGWLIERDCTDGIEYVHTFAEWTRDANNALRFHRKGDAEDTVQIFFDEVDGVRVTEHAWDDGNEPQRRVSSSRQAVLEEAKDSERAILLARVVGFAVGSAAAEEHAGLISEFERLGFVTRRKHYSKVGSWEAYALTDSGFDHLERIASRNLTQRCLRAHIFYLRNTTTPPAEGETK